MTIDDRGVNDGVDIQQPLEMFVMPAILNAGAARDEWLDAPDVTVIKDRIDRFA
jgi:hypothetical protein